MASCFLCGRGDLSDGGSCGRDGSSDGGSCGRDGSSDGGSCGRDGSSDGGSCGRDGSPDGGSCLLLELCFLGPLCLSCKWPVTVAKFESKPM